jgi:hypothetical protein
MYQIDIGGRVTQRIESALEGMRLEADAAKTPFSGEVRGQSQLYAVLSRVHDVDLELVTGQSKLSADEAGSAPRHVDREER